MSWTVERKRDRELAKEAAEITATGWRYLNKPSPRGEVVRASVMTRDDVATEAGEAMKLTNNFGFEWPPDLIPEGRVECFATSIAAQARLGTLNLHIRFADFDQRYFTISRRLFSDQQARAIVEGAARGS